MNRARTTLWASITMLCMVPSLCPGFSSPIAHEGALGGFDLTGTEFEGVGGLCQASGPPLRFWWYDNFALANSGAQNPFLPCFEWLHNANLDYAPPLPGSGPGTWISVNTNWWGNEIKGRPADTRPGISRTVVEINFPDGRREGTQAHRGFFLIATVSDCYSYNLDLVADGLGAQGNVVPVQEIPAAQPPSPNTSPNPVMPSFLDVELTLADVRSYGDTGHPERIDGYRLYYKLGGPPTSSLTAAYDGEVLDPSDPLNPLGTIPYGTGNVVATVPGPQPLEGVYLVTALVYKDSTQDVRSLATSAHLEVKPGVSTDALLRDDSIGSLDPLPDRNAIFPLPVYKAPAPSLPYVDEDWGILTDAARPLVYYGHSSEPKIRLYADKTPGVESVRVDNR